MNGKTVGTREKNAAAGQRWRQTLLNADATLQQAIQNLDASGAQIVLVVAPTGILLGTLTDGDIRRGLLRGMDLSSPINPIVTREPLVVPVEMHRDIVMQLMQTNKLRQLPVVDQNRKVVGLHIWDDMYSASEKQNMMIIMAGGLGTRLRPFTEHCPKPLLPVGGKPMLEHIIERARQDGFGHFALAINYLGNMIEDYFGDGSRWNVNIDYIREKSPLGTAGAIGLLDPRPDLPFIVSNGDVLTDIRYGELLDFHCRHRAAATMAVRLHEWQHPFGVVRIDGVDIVGFEEKPVARTHVNAGIYVLEPNVIDILERGERCDMPTLFVRLQERAHRVIAYPMHEPWLDVGRPDDYSKAAGLGDTTLNDAVHTVR